MSAPRVTRESIQRSRDTITWSEVVDLADRFRREIGGVYDYVAACLLRDHEHLRPADERRA